MSKTAVSRHVYVDDPACPGTCRDCRLVDPKRTNERHKLPDNPSQALDRRRLGEREDNE